MHGLTKLNDRQPGWPSRLPALLLAAGLPLLPIAALAQSDAPERQYIIEEVFVTAQRREQSLMDVPLSVTAYSGEELARMGALDIISISQTTPNTTLEVSRGTNSTLTAFIRGVGQQDPVAGFEAGVGLYVDDVYLNRPQAAVLEIFDVERIEVLRGPQGTLYGRNTIGGAIKYVTRPLADTPEFKARGRLGSDSMMDLILTGSAPLTDTFRIGASIASLNRDGFGDNLVQPGVENYQKDILGARFSAEWEPGESWFFRFSADWIEDDSDPRQGHRLTVGNFSGAPILDNVFDTRSGLDNPEQEVEAKGASLLAEWQASDLLTLRAIFAYRDDESWSPIDFDSLPGADLDVPVVYENEQSSAEFQALFSGERWNGIAGFYYLDANAFNAFDVILGLTGDVIGLPGLNSFTLGDVDTETWSVFGDFTYDLSDQWAVSVGGRYTEDKRSSKILRQTMIFGTSEFFGGNAVPIATTSDFQGSETFDKFTPRLSVQWRPNDDQTLYATYSEGFKGGSFDPRGLTSNAPDLNGDGVVSEEEVFAFMSFEPEEVESLEFGIKSTLFGGRVTSNLSLFLGDYKDVQVPGSVGVDTDGDGIDDQFVGITSNAASADINGVEWEGRAILAQDLGVSGGDLELAWAIGYIDAEYNEFIDALGEDVADERVFQNTPEWTAAGTLSYNLPVNWFNTPGRLGLMTTVSFRDDHSQFEVPTPLLDQDAYTLWDLSVVWTDDSGHWQLGLHGKNLTDKEYKVAGYFFPTLGLESTITAFYGNPRQYWLDLQYRWF
ncbi:MAG: TonB-dependent receptor [Xanthomonadales bacterium]|nr:TonB-dependent receptor [Xanthomonadales bacterium]